MSYRESEKERERKKRRNVYINIIIKLKDIHICFWSYIKNGMAQRSQDIIYNPTFTTSKWVINDNIGGETNQMHRSHESTSILLTAYRNVSGYG